MALKTRDGQKRGLKIGDRIVFYEQGGSLVLRIADDEGVDMTWNKSTSKKDFNVEIRDKHELGRIASMMAELAGYEGVVERIKTVSDSYSCYKIVK
ncbi:hypothetical protein A3B18_00205 [Candidatus Giovannonibacteria bacterium RIFCSPLOWO2_01_FULL_46_13]|uniref:Uncharacterized protein n=1 Tax=Candidatus Giovannonibacteria bacterium RIFCSPLOWO2_01_FULL_46_13 TaxID=1798352 RepID=A0A1F5X396_9BACT|nr:MAG: hypothetical protein A3B18_00205 [Candidatus Giovannonibacteria bacterium RIFCSPLOWO2_01_FULL_46_13]